MKGWPLNLGRAILLAVLFALVYTQAPLYTSNQNQYFLHGLAQAGFGHLAEDWLANTLDPTPVFSAMVRWIYQLTQLPGLFYLVYVLLMGIYINSALGIIELAFPLRQTGGGWRSTRYLVFLSLFLLVHSAALRFALSRLLGDNWSFLLEDGVADQRLLGLVLQPSAFGVLLVLAIYLFLKRRPYWAVICAVLAATVHPTYLISAAALTAAFVLIRSKEWLANHWRAARADGEAKTQPGTKKMKKKQVLFFLRGLLNAWLPGLFALLIVLPILSYAYLNFGDTPPQSTAQAQEILVQFRVPHHALVSWWFDATAVIKIVLVLVALYLVRKQRLVWILGVPFVLALLLTLGQIYSGSNFLALLFPWRVSTFLVPLSTGLILAWLVQKLSGLYLKLAADRINTRPVKRSEAAFGAPMPRPSPLSEAVVRAASLNLIGLLVLIGLVRMTLDFQRKAAAPEAPMLAFVAGQRQPGQVFLTPVKMQEFRLETGAPAYVDFKSIPYQDDDVLEWYRREKLAEQFYKNQDCSLLGQFSAGEGVTHVILPLQEFTRPCVGLNPLYQDQVYGVFEFQ